MKVVIAASLPRLGFFLTGAALGLVGCQTGAVSTSDFSRPTAFAVEAGASLQDEEEGDEMGMAADGEAAQSKDKKPSPEEKLADATEERVLAEQARSYAETESTLAQLKQQAGEIEVAESLRAKRAALQAARDELSTFGRRKAPLELREARVDLERARDRVLKAETDLANMREIMGEEAEAKNKEEIIRRYETSLKFAQEGLIIQTDERALLVDAEHPAKLAKLSGAVRAAEAALQAEEIHASRKRGAAGLEVRKAKHNFDKAKRKLKKVSRKEKQLKKEAKAGEGDR